MIDIEHGWPVTWLAPMGDLQPAATYVNGLREGRLINASKNRDYDLDKDVGRQLLHVER